MESCLCEILEMDEPTCSEGEILICQMQEVEEGGE